MTPRNRRRVLAWTVFLLLVMLPVALTLLGETVVHPAQLFQPGFAETPLGRIFWQLRVPRVALGFLAGAALALAGMVFQAIFRNPLATPFTLGVSSGASLGVAVALKLGVLFTVAGFSSVSLFSFTGALITVAFIYLLASLRREFSTDVMLLAGVALSFFFSAAILFMQYLSDISGTYHLVRWLMGDLNAVGFERPLQLLAVLAPCAGVILYHVQDLNLILAGEDLARTRGVHVTRVKIVVFFVVSLLTGVVVSFCGPIGFVVMMVPHFLRLWLGAEHRRLLGACLLGGGAFLAVCDFVARTVISPAEMPVGILTALLGGPFFLWLLIRGRYGRFYF
jgi:iron complex transport system permease protein